MVGDDYADILLFERCDDTLNILHCDRIDSGERLVEQNERRVDGDGSRNLRTATLATGELVTVTLAHLLQAELLDERLQAVTLILLRVGGHFEHCANIVLDTQATKYGCLLCQVADAQLRTLIYGQRREFVYGAIVVFEEDTSFVGLNQTHNHIERRSFACSVRAQQAHNLALTHVN